MSTKDVAILDDDFGQMGGSQRVAIEIAREFNAPIYSARVNPQVPPNDVDVRPAFTKWWEQRAMNSHHLVQDAFQMLGWQYVDALGDYDTVIINKNNAGWYVPRDDQTVVKYVHSTPRNAYDRFHQTDGSYKRRILNTVIRTLYRPNIAYPDAWACNSDLVARRLQKYWGLNADQISVIYPPVNVNTYHPDDAPTQDYYLTISRLVGHKRIDEIIQAFNQLGDDYTLKVAGTGPYESTLQEIAGANVEFLGYVDETQKRRLLAGARGFVFAAENEDFGLTPIESMAAGTPVIGVQDGFTQHQLINQKNGLLYTRGGSNLQDVIRRFDRDGVDWTPGEIQAFSERFSAKRFRASMRELVEAATKANEIHVPWKDTTQPPSGESVAKLADGRGGGIE